MFIYLYDLTQTSFGCSPLITLRPAHAERILWLYGARLLLTGRSMVSCVV